MSTEEFELDLSNFELSERTSNFFEKVAGMLKCKLDADELYEKVGTGELKKPIYDSCGNKPMQEGPEKMTVDQVMSDAESKIHLFEPLLKNVVEQAGMEPNREVIANGKPITTAFGSYTHLTLARLKSEERSRAKVKDDYNGNAKFLCDVGRATIVCNSEDQIAQAIDTLRRKTDVVRIKNRFAHPLYEGTRVVLMNIKVEGHVFEVQVHLADTLALNKRSDAHRFYEYFREYFVGNQESYKKRTEMFRRLGEAVLANDSSITEGIRSILEGNDKAKLEALEEITSDEVLSDLELSMKAIKRLIALLLEVGGQEEAVLNWLHKMGNVYLHQTNYEKALELHKRALEGYEAALDTLTTVNNVADVYYNQGNHEIALDHYKGNILTTVGNMAIAYYELGKYEKALELFQRTLEGKKAAHGNDHVDTLGAVHNMGRVYEKQGNCEKALEFYQQALEGYEAAFGKDHQSTLNTVNNIAMVYKHQGNYEKALESYQRALEGKEAVLGKDHPDTIGAVHNMGEAYAHQGKFEEALEFFRRAYVGYKALHGNDHPYTIVAAISIATARNFLNSTKERQAKDREAAPGNHHLDTLSIVYNKANVYENQGNYEKALEFYQRAYVGLEAALGINHPQTISTVISIASVYDHLRGKEAALGNDDPSTLGTVNNIAMMYEKQGNYEKALEFHQRGLEGKEAALGNDHPETLGSVNNIGNVYFSQGNFSKALEWYKRALEGREAALGNDHLDTLTTVYNTGNVYARRGNYEKALEFFQRAYDGFVVALGYDDPRTISTAYSITSVYDHLGNSEKAV